jgi:hypothetical protein
MDPELRRRLRAVDPDLRIVSRHGRKKKGKGVNQRDWELAAGQPCPKCGREDVRFIRGVCRDCHHAQKEKLVKQEASLTPLINNCKDKKLASRVQRYLAKLDRRA